MGYVWLALAALCVVDTIVVLVYGRDFSGNDGGADERVWR